MKKKLIIITTIIFCVFLFIVFFNNNKNTNNLSSLRYKQYNMEKEFKDVKASIDNPKIIVDPYNISPLTALIIFQTNKPESAKITIHGKDKLTTFEHSFPSTKEHFIPVLGLYSGKNKVSLDIGQIHKEITITTKEFPKDIKVAKIIKKDATKLTSDLYFYTSASKTYPVAYDANGDIRWYLNNKNMTWVLRRLHNGHITISTERLINKPYYSVGMYEIDLLGKIYNEYVLPGGYHHDYYEMKNGNFLIASNKFSKYTVEDYIVELDRKSGKIVKEWDLKNILDKDCSKNQNATESDWFHNNSIWYDQDTNSITLSGRHKDAVINIDYNSGKLKWIIGDPNTWKDKYKKYFFKPIGDNFEWQWSQHAAMLLPNNRVFIFDNGNNKSKYKDKYIPASKSYSRGVIYDIDTNKMTIKQSFEYGKGRGKDFYSSYISDVDYLGQNHYIIHSGGIAYIDGKISNSPPGLIKSKNKILKSNTVEILNNNVIFEIQIPANYYRLEKLALYSKNNYSIGNSNYIGNLGKTKINKESFNPLIVMSKKSNKDIEITKEEDRLVIKGEFPEHTLVSVILEKNKYLKFYDINVSKHQYKAMCVDLNVKSKTNKNIVVFKYINNENLKGKYNIYLSINNVIYNTGYYTIFK